MSISLKSITFVEDGVVSCVFAGGDDEVTVVMANDDLGVRTTPDIFSWSGINPRVIMQAVTAFQAAAREQIAWPQVRGPLTRG